MKLSNADYVVLALLIVAAAAFFWYHLRGLSFKGVLSLFDNRTGQVVQGNSAKPKPSYDERPRRSAKHDNSDLKDLLNKATAVSKKIVPTTEEEAAIINQISIGLDEAANLGLSLQKFASKIYDFVAPKFDPVIDDGETSNAFGERQRRILVLVFQSLEDYAKKLGVGGSKQVILQITDDFLRDTVGIRTIQDAIRQNRGRVHFNERAEAMMDAIIKFFTQETHHLALTSTSQVRSQFKKIAIDRYFEMRIRDFERLSESRKSHERAEEMKRATQRRNRREKTRRR